MGHSFDLNDLAHRQRRVTIARGWDNKTNLECLALVASEVGEAINECRGTEPSDAFGEELADIILRTLDLAKANDLDINQLVLNKLLKNESKAHVRDLKKVY